MKSERVISKITIIFGATFLFMCIFFSKIEYAVEEINNISNRWFYIKNSYTVTYHSTNTLNKPLTELYQKYPNSYFKMYQIH